MALNETLRSMALKVRPHLVWIDKGTWVYPFILQSLKKAGCELLHYNTDDVLASVPEFWLHRLGIPLYDLYLTTNRHNVTEITRMYGVKAVRAGMGYDAEILNRRLQYDQPDSDAAYLFFGGHWEPHSEAYVRALRSAGIEVRVSGHNWRKAKDSALKTVQALPYDAYLDRTSAAPMALCFLSRRNRNDTTIRSFEIPALGTALFAERTAEHEFIYGDGTGAVLFSGEDEAIAKSKYYLSHPAERARVAAQGRHRCLGLKLTWEDHIVREWRIVEREIFGEPGWEAVDDRPFWPGYRTGANWNPATGPLPGE
jgi:hypothetical protein